MLAVAVSATSAQDEASSAGYDALIEGAVQEFAAHRFQEARALFRQAHHVSPNARTLRGIGLCSYELREYVEAYRALTAALDDPRRALTDEQRAQVQSLLAATGRFVGVFRLDMTPADASVSVDDVEATIESDGRLVLPLGSHGIDARASGFVTTSRTLEVVGGESETLTLSLDSAGQTATSPTEGHANSDASSSGPVDVALIISGGILSVASVATGLAWWFGRQQAANECASLPPVSTTDFGCGNPNAIYTARDAAAGVTVGMAVLGVAGVVSGVVLLLLDDDDGGVALSCSPGLGGAVCSGRF